MDQPENQAQATGQVLQTWVPPALAVQVKARAQSEHRTISALIRLAIEDKLARSRKAAQ